MTVQLDVGDVKALVIFDIDGVVRDVSASYRRAIADTVESFTHRQYRPTLSEIDDLKAEGVWNNDWEASQELIYRFFESQQQTRADIALNFTEIIDFFQSRYRGENFSGYIQDEPLLLSRSYLDHLSAQAILWGFFSGATRGSAEFVLKGRLGLQAPVLVAMEDAPGKPDPAGLFQTVEALYLGCGGSWSPTLSSSVPIIYVGDTSADMATVGRAKLQAPEHQWLAVGVVPPHVTDELVYAQRLRAAGAAYVLNRAEFLTADFIQQHVLDGPESRNGDR